VIKLPRAAQVLIRSKVRLGFKRDSALFDQALKAAEHPPDKEPPSSHNPPSAGTLGPDMLPFPLTDSGNGERIVALFGMEIRFCIEMKKWLVWDGRRWAIDERRVIRQKAKQMARLLHAQATGHGEIEKWARKTEASGALQAALDCASTEPGVPVAAAELDEHPLPAQLPQRRGGPPLGQSAAA
jgi:hypothetical protein